MERSDQDLNYLQFLHYLLHTLPLKRQEKMHLKMSSAEVICCK